MQTFLCGRSAVTLMLPIANKINSNTPHILLLAYNAELSSILRMEQSNLPAHSPCAVWCGGLMQTHNKACKAQVSFTLPPPSLQQACNTIKLINLPEHHGCQQCG